MVQSYFAHGHGPESLADLLAQYTGLDISSTLEGDCSLRNVLLGLCEALQGMCFENGGFHVEVLPSLLQRSLSRQNPVLLSAGECTARFCNADGLPSLFRAHSLLEEDNDNSMSCIQCLFSNFGLFCN